MRLRYAPDDSGRFHAQWIENAVKGTFDHVCLVCRRARRRSDPGIFALLRKLNEREARIGLLAGRGMGQNSCRRRCTGGAAAADVTLRVATKLRQHPPRLNVILRVAPPSTPRLLVMTGDKMMFHLTPPSSVTGTRLLYSLPAAARQALR